MDKVEKEFINELKLLGYKYNAVFDLPMWGEFLDSSIVDCMLKWYPSIAKKNVANGCRLCQSLVAARFPFNPSVLIDLFENGDERIYQRSNIAITLAFANTIDISDWIKNQLINKPYSGDKSPLLSAIPIKLGIKSREEGILFIQSLFDKYSSEAIYLQLYKGLGNKGSDVDYLKEKLELTTDRELIKNLKLVIKHIESRKTEPKWKPIFWFNNSIPLWLKKSK